MHPLSFHLAPGRRYVVRADGISEGFRSLAYEVDARTLDIEFPSGGTYRYFEVTAREFRALLQAESKGAHVNSHIKPNHRCEKLGPRAG